MSTNPDAEVWLPLAEAAARLGLSRHQLRRRVRAGQMASRQVAGPHGPAYEVRLDPDATVASGARHGDDHHGGATVTVTPPLTELVSLVRDTQAQLLQTTAAAAMWQARAELLGIQLQQAQERILALEAPKEPDPSLDALRGPTDATVVVTAQHRANANAPGGASGERRWTTTGRT